MEIGRVADTADHIEGLTVYLTSRPIFKVKDRCAARHLKAAGFVPGWWPTDEDKVTAGWVRGSRGIAWPAPAPRCL